MINRKIRNAKACTLDGHTFKSRLECACYSLLKQSGLEFTYEGEKFTLWKGIKLVKTLLFTPERKKESEKKRKLHLQRGTLKDMTYTPDFIVTKGNVTIYFDVKGIPNDVYPIKKKMFLKYLEEHEEKAVFFEPHNVGQMVEAIAYIKDLDYGDNKGES